MLLQDILIIFSFLSGIFFFLKLLKRKDYTYIATALSRLYLGIIYLLYAHAQIIDLDVVDVRLAVIIVLFSDIAVTSLYFLTSKFRKQIEYTHLLDQLKELGNKYTLLAENNLIGLFTTDREGRIEIANQRLLEILEVEHSYDLIGKNLFDYVEIKCREEITASYKFNCKDVIIKTKSGEKVANISGGATHNGHPTITGVIQTED